MATRKAAPRRAADQNGIGNAWWRPALLLLGVLLMAGSTGTWVAALVTDPHRLPLETIRITGELSHVDRAKLQQLVAAAIDGGFFSVDMHKLRDAAEQLAWVDKVSIRRVWPQTLVMDVTEQVPVGRWGDQALVNARGEIFRPQAGELPQGLPRLHGEGGDGPVVVEFHRSASRRLEAIGLEIVALEVQGRHDWRLELNNGVTLLLGQAGAAQVLERFTLALPLLVDPQGRRPQRVDMRYENGFAVRWMPAADVSDKSDKRGDA
jgi:cell division protein FtsQ